MTEHIQINDVSPSVSYTATGAQSAFSFPFAIFRAEDLEVWLDESKQGAGYAVSGAGITTGGTVLFAAPPAVGTGVTLRRRLALARTSDFQADGLIRAKTLNDEFDYQVAALQQVAEEFGRAVRRSPTSRSAAKLTLPEPNAGRGFKWDAAGTAIINTDVDPDAQALAAEAHAVAAAASALTAAAQMATATAKAAAAAASATLAQNAAGNNVRGVRPEQAPPNWALGGLAMLDRLPEELLIGARVESVTAGASLTLDLGGIHGRAFALTLTANLTLAFVNPPVAGKLATVLLLATQDATGGRTVTWPAAVKWSGGVAPSADTAAGRVNIYSLFTLDGGVCWHAALAAAGSR